jgi:limonene-1,2-epoxide hydrolase
MGATQEAVVRSLIDSLNADDRESVAAHFCEDATWRMIAWRPPLEGRVAIRAALDAMEGSGFHYEIVSMASTDHVVFAEIIDTHERDGRQITMHWTSVTEVNDAGLILAERDYWDTAELSEQESRGSSASA